MIAGRPTYRSLRGPRYRSDFLILHVWQARSFQMATSRKENWYSLLFSISFHFYWTTVFSGSGKFGTVYVVMNLQSGGLLAMKQLKIDRNHRAMKALIDEVENLERLQHPNLVRYYGVEVHRVGGDEFLS
jgi:hypothetical protein